MNFKRFNVSLERNRPANSKNGVSSSGKNLSAKLSGMTLSIDIKLIEDNPDQARSFMNTNEFETLKQSIKREGLLHPIIVYKDARKGKYITKAGHRRLRAIRELGFTQVDCAVFTSKTEATFAAISTNEFAESIHPIDKGVEVDSLIREFKESGVDVPMKDIADFYGTSTSTIYEWRRYVDIDKSVRSEILSRDIRSKDFLRKATKICKEIRSKNYSEVRRIKEVNDSIAKLISRASLKSKVTAKSGAEKSDLPENGRAKISNYLYYVKSEDEYKVREDSIKRLSSDERARLKVRALELLELL